MIRIEGDSLFAYSTEFSKNLVRVSLVKHPFGEISCVSSIYYVTFSFKTSLPLHSLGTEWSCKWALPH